jgi:hypothetical protein
VSKHGQKPLSVKTKLVASPKARSNGHGVALDLAMGGPDEEDAQFKSYS